MAVADEFSFPAISRPTSHFSHSAPSSSLWPISSHDLWSYASDSGEDHNRPMRCGGGDSSRTSFSYGAGGGGGSEAEEDEDRMDMLWEDFNEELQRKTPLRNKKEEITSLRIKKEAADGFSSNSAGATGGIVVSSKRSGGSGVAAAWKALRRISVLRKLAPVGPKKRSVFSFK